MRPLVLLSTAALSLLAQDVPRPTFEVASIKPSPEPAGSGGRALAGVQDHLTEMEMAQARGGGQVGRTGRVTLRRQTLAMLIGRAYSISPDQVAGPTWITDLRFDLDAELPDGASPTAVPDMLETLLADRFALRLHRDDKQVSGYALIIAKSGPKLTPAAPPSSDSERSPDPEAMKAKLQEQALANLKAQIGSGVSPGGSSSSRHFPNATMTQVAAHLSATLHKPVIDATSLTGQYDVTIAYTKAADEDIDSATDRGLAPLGLKLESRKIPVTAIVVDGANKTPAQN